MSPSQEFSSDECEKIEELRRRLSIDIKSKMYDDELMFYRFLKARDFNIDNAEIMLRNHLQWREKNGVESILKDYKTNEVLEKYLPINFVGYDKEGCVVRYVPFGRIDAKGLCFSVKYAEFERKLVHVMEEDVSLLEKQSKAFGKRVHKCIYIDDVEGLSFATASNRRCIEDIMTFCRLYQNNYPERLKAVIIINASMYFQFGFSIIKPCLAGTILEKVHIFGADGWKEELLKYMDAEQLPAFLGGKKTDPDGNPKCKTFIKRAEIVPETYYIHKSKRALADVPGAKRVVLTRAAFHEETIFVEEPGSFIEWEFETKTRDIGFGLFLHDEASGEGLMKEIVPIQRIDTEEYAETGMYKCELAGKYMMVFDNTYSWIRSKELFFKINVIPPKDKSIEIYN